MFTSAIEAAENQSAVGAANFFAAPGTAPVTLTLGGADAGLFAITAAGTLTFNDAPNFEMPRSMAFDAGTNTNDYALTVTAMNSIGSVASGAITVRVTDANDRPAVTSITTGSYMEYSEGTFEFVATDEDATQTLTYALTGNTFGATMSPTGTFRWTPREEDGGVLRSFTVTVTDDGTPPLVFSTFFIITATELPNRAPTGATITAAAMLTYPNPITLEAAATDPDTGTTLTYAWSLPAIADGSVSPVNAASATYTPPTLAEGAAARMIVITLTVSDDATPPLTATATHTVTVNPPVPAGTAPVFTNSAMFTSAIEAAENQSAAGVANFFAAPGTAPVTLTLGGADATRFAITDGGTLTFADAPNFERPRGMALSGSNTNDYALTVTAMNSVDSVASGAITVRVTDVNEAPVLPAITPPAFIEYTAGSFDITATDVDAGQTLTFALNAPNHGATLSSTGTFTWTPGEDDGTVARTFSVTVTDSATTPMMTTGTFDITAMELANRAPINATLTVAGGATTVTNPNTLGLSATATDPDTGDMLTYTWSSSATGDSFSPATGASTSWTPPTVTAATVVTLTVTITDSTDGSVTATQNVTVNPMVTAPTFTNTFTTPVTAAENQTAAGAAGFFAATATGGPVSYALTGADMAFFTLSSTGTLTFNDAPDFERPRGNPLTAGNTNNYALNIAATANGLTTNSPAFTVRVTDVNEAPTITSPAAGAFTASTFTEYSAGTFNVAAADVDDGQTLTYALTAGAAFGAAINADSGAFTWTPREVDGGEERMFTIMVTDSGSPPMTATVTFSITPMELANRIPTGLTITAPTPVTNPATPTVAASATDPDTDMLTYTWSSSAGGDTFNPTTGASVTWTPATVMIATTVTLTVVVTDGAGGSVTSTQDVLVNPAATIPVFANPDDVAFMVVEGTTAAGAANQFSATGTGAVTLTLGGTDAGLFTLTSGGTLTFNNPPDFEMPRGMAFDAGSNTNSYPLTVTATASGLTGSMSFTVTVTDENEAPVLAAITPSAFTEYSPGTFAITATDVDAGQTLSYALNGETHGATLTTGGTFTWTPGEDDGGMARTFSVTVTDTGTPPMMATGTFDITAVELANRAPTGATITAAATLTAPNPITLMASASDPDTGTTLTYAWAVTTADGGTIAPTTGASATYTPPALTAGDAARMIVITLTVSDDATTPLTATATHTVTVNPPVAAGTAPAFTNMAMFTTPIEAAENQSAAAAANFFAAPGSGTVALTLGGADATRFAITAGGTLTFADAPNFEMPRGMAFVAGSNTNDYALTVTAMNAFGSAMSGAITVTVTDENEAPVLSAIPTPTFTEYTAGGFTIAATDVDRPAQTLAFALTGETHGATLDAGGGFSWTPREMDGTVARTFNVMVTDSGTPPQMASTTFAITAAELANRAPTGVMITNTETTIQNPATLTVSATASDPDTGDMLTYTWSVPIGGGTFDSATGASVVWTPPDVTAATTITLTVTVSDGTAMATDTHDIIVQPVPDSPPIFRSGESISDQVYMVDVPITPVTLPAVETEGNGATMYTLLTPPTGLTFDADTRILSGTPTVVRTTTAATYTARDSDMNNDLTDIATLTVSFTVNAMPEVDIAPAFSVTSFPAQNYIVGTMITPLTLPAATSGNGAITYTLTPPPGLVFDAATRVLSGAPTTAAVATMYAYTAGDTDGSAAGTDEVSLMFSITVEANPAPVFAVTSIPTQTYIANSPIEPLTLPVATGGNGASTYTLTPALPTGLTFDGTARTITGTPTTVAVATMYTYTAGDSDGSAAGTDVVSLMFSITVEANTAPVFSATSPFEPSETIAQNRMVTLTLPAATGGNGPIIYTLAASPALPAGLTFDAATRVITGTPEDIVAEMDYTYTAADSDGSTGAGDEDTLVVRFEVIQAPPEEIRLSVTPAAVTESTTATTITVTATLIGGTFTDARNISVMSTDGTATAGTDYTAVPDTALTFPANMASATATFEFTANVDTEAEAGGETVIIGRNLATAGGTGAVDREIPVSPATLTINDYTPVTVSAGADRTVGYGGTIRLNGGITSAAGATVVITWALSDSTAATAAFVAAGLGTTEARAEVTRLTAALTAITTAAATLPAPAVSLMLTDPVALAFTLTATDSTPPAGQSAAAMATDEVIITVVQDTAPAFAAGAAIPAQIYTVGTAIAPLTLPAATGGDGAITYTLTRPAGLNFDAATRVLTGTPTTAAAATRFIYTAADSDDNIGPTDTATLTFSITVDAAPGVTLEQAQDIARNEIILPEVARALVHSTTSSITRRVGQAVGSVPVPPLGSFNLAGQQMGGQDNLAMAVRTHGETMSTDGRDIKEMLAGSDFVLPLNAGGTGAGSSAVALWGSGEYRNFSGESDDLDWDGDLSGAQVGIGCAPAR